MNKIWCVLLVISSGASFGQSIGTQAWGEYFLNFPFSTVYNMKYKGSYSTEFGASGWRAIDNSLSVERAFGSNTDVSLTGLVSYTDQSDTYSTLELRPTVGVRYHIRPDRRVHTRIYLRYENRHFKNLEEGDWTQTNRLRIRPELLYTFQRKSYHDDDIWYGIMDIEWFATLDGDQEERFANRFRTRLGLGYRHNYSFRFELIYALQQSRNTIEEEFIRSNHILYFRLKQYLRKKVPIKHSLDRTN